MDQSNHAKSKGDLGVLKAQVDLFERVSGLTVSPRVETSKNGQSKEASLASDLAGFRRDYTCGA